MNSQSMRFGERAKVPARYLRVTSTLKRGARANYARAPRAFREFIGRVPITFLFSELFLHFLWLLNFENLPILAGENDGEERGFRLRAYFLF